MFPIAHIAAPLLALAVYDKYLRVKRDEEVPSLHFIIIAVSGVIPDLLGFHVRASGRLTLSHSLFFPLAVFLIYLVLRRFNKRYSTYVFLVFTGLFIHFLLDMVTAPVYPFYPLSTLVFDEFVLFPLRIITREGVAYLDIMGTVAWYSADLLFFAGFVLVEKTPFVERIYHALN